MAELRHGNGARKYGFSLAGEFKAGTRWNAYRISDELPIGELVEHYDPLTRTNHYRAYVNDSFYREFDDLHTAFLYLCARAELAELESVSLEVR